MLRAGAKSLCCRTAICQKHDALSVCGQLKTATDPYE
jgi:hypothetical protein